MNAVLLAALPLLLAGTPEVGVGTPPPSPVVKAVLLPVRVPQDANGELKSVAVALERVLVVALERQGGFKLVSRRELEATMGKAMASQLEGGCTEDSCLAEVADALGATITITSSLDHSDAVWTLSASLVDRTAAQVLRRSTVRARSVDGLLGSVDVLARALATGGPPDLEDPLLPKRLGTNSEGVAALKETVGPTKGDVDVVEAWTTTVVARNGESEALAVAEGLLLGAIPVAAFGALVLLLPPAIYSQFVAARTTPLGYGGATGPARADTVVAYPLLWGAGLVFLAGLTQLVPVGLLAAVTALAVVDLRQPGRIPVAPEGCCRNELRVRRAQVPGWGRLAAPFITLGVTAAGVAGAVAVAALIAFPAQSFLSGPGKDTPAVTGPTLAIPYQQAILVNAGAQAVYLGLMLGGLAVGLGAAAVGAAILFLVNRAQPVDG